MGDQQKNGCQRHPRPNPRPVTITLCGQKDFADGMQNFENILDDPGWALNVVFLWDRCRECGCGDSGRCGNGNKRKGAQAKVHRRLPELEEARKRSSPRASAGSTVLPTVGFQHGGIPAQETRIRVLTSRAVRKQVCVISGRLVCSKWLQITQGLCSEGLHTSSAVTVLKF